jgi:hypothetical protein
MKTVILESPYAGDIERNTEYARKCVRDSLLRGEAPIASHLLYTQPGILREEIPEERQHGIDAGHAWLRFAWLMAVYTDYGISRGMKSRNGKSARTIYRNRRTKNPRSWLAEPRYTTSVDRDQQWYLAMAKLDALAANIPSRIKQSLVDEFHEILELFANATAQDIAVFRIPEDKTQKVVISFSSLCRNCGPWQKW